VVSCIPVKLNMQVKVKRQVEGHSRKDVPFRLKQISISTSGPSYLDVGLTTVHHLYNVASQERSPTFVVSVARPSVSRRTSPRTVVSVASHHLYNVVSQARSPTFVVSVTRPSVSRRTSSRTVGSTPGSSRLPVTRAPGRSSARWTFDVTPATSISLKRDDTNVKYRHGARFTKYLTDNLTIMPKLRSTYDGRLIYIRSHEEGKAFCRYDSLAKW